MGTIVTLLIGYKYRIAHARAFFDGGEYFGGIGQLRHPFRTDETARLDGLQSAGRQAIDQLDLHRRWNDRLFVLQPVAGTHFDDADMVGKPAWFQSRVAVALASRLAKVAVATSGFGFLDHAMMP